MYISDHFSLPLRSTILFFIIHRALLLIGYPNGKICENPLGIVQCSRGGGTRSGKVRVCGAGPPDPLPPPVHEFVKNNTPSSSQRGTTRTKFSTPSCSRARPPSPAISFSIFPPPPPRSLMVDPLINYPKIHTNLVVVFLCLPNLVTSEYLNSPIKCMFN